MGNCRWDKNHRPGLWSVLPHLSHRWINIDADMNERPSGFGPTLHVTETPPSRKPPPPPTHYRFKKTLWARHPLLPRLFRSSRCSQPAFQAWNLHITLAHGAKSERRVSRDNNVSNKWTQSSIGSEIRFQSLAWPLYHGAWASYLQYQPSSLRFIRSPKFQQQ
jgi:hypothetical protein